MMKQETLFSLKPTVVLRSGIHPIGEPQPYTYCVLEFHASVPVWIRQALDGIVEDDVEGPDVDDLEREYVWLLDNPHQAKKAAQAVRRKLHLFGVLPASKLFNGTSAEVFGSESVLCRPSLRGYERWAGKHDTGVLRRLEAFGGVKPCRKARKARQGDSDGQNGANRGSDGADLADAARERYRRFRKSRK